MLLVGPDDMMNFKKIYRALGKEDELPVFPIQSNCMAAIKVRPNVRLRESGTCLNIPEHAATFRNMPDTQAVLSS